MTAIRAPAVNSHSRYKLWYTVGFPVCTFLVCVCLMPVIAADVVQVSSTPEYVIPGFPPEQNHPTIDMFGGYVGVISGEFPKNRFVFFDDSGRFVFAVDSEEGQPFYLCDIKAGPGVVALTASVREGEYNSYAYDYSGKRIFGPIRTDSPLSPSPDAKYWHTTYNPFTGSSPRIYDQWGRVLNEFAVADGVWQLAAVSDSIVLFYYNEQLTLMSVPGLVVITEHSVEGLKTPDKWVTGLSPDRTCFALSGYDRLAICRLETGEISYVSIVRNDGINLTPLIALSPEGEQLLLYSTHGTTISVHVRQDNRYEKVTDRHRVMVGYPAAFPYRQPSFTGGVWVLNYFGRSADGITYASYIFNSERTIGTGLEGSSFEGYASVLQRDSVLSLGLFLPGDNRKGKTAALHRLELVGDIR